jgi:hypothetical protein
MVDIMGIIEPVINYIIVLIFGGAAGGAYGLKQKINLKDVIQSMLPNSGVKTVPSVLKTEENADTYKTTQKERDYILSTISDLSLKSAISNFIDAKEDAGCRDYTFRTTDGEWRIQNGYIDKDPVLEKLLAASIATAEESAKAKEAEAEEAKANAAQPMSANQQPVGDADIAFMGSNHIELYDGVVLNQSEFIGEEIDIRLTGTRYGDVEVGMFWDGHFMKSWTCRVNIKDGKLDAYETATFRFPQYITAPTVGDMSVGEHIMGIAFGYYSGYKETGVNRGDQTIWTRTVPYKIIVAK